MIAMTIAAMRLMTESVFLIFESLKGLDIIRLQTDFLYLSVSTLSKIKNSRPFGTAEKQWLHIYNNEKKKIKRFRVRSHVQSNQVSKRRAGSKSVQ